MKRQSEAIRDIYEGVHKCTRCHGNPIGTIKPDPDKVSRRFFSQIMNSKIFMVAQSLAKGQVRLSGVPFHNSQGVLSRGGQYLEKYFNRVGYTIRPDKKGLILVYSTDIVQCYPGRRKEGKGDNIPLDSEIQNCKPWLDQEFSLLEPEVILLFGAPATRMFYKYYMKKEFFKLQDYYLEPETYETQSVFVLPHPTSMVAGKSQIYDQTFREIYNIIKKC